MSASHAYEVREDIRRILNLYKYSMPNGSKRGYSGLTEDEAVERIMELFGHSPLPKIKTAQLTTKTLEESR